MALSKCSVCAVDRHLVVSVDSIVEKKKGKENLQQAWFVLTPGPNFGCPGFVF
jgi:hypothetical protein